MYFTNIVLNKFTFCYHFTIFTTYIFITLLYNPYSNTIKINIIKKKVLVKKQICIKKLGRWIEKKLQNFRVIHNNSDTDQNFYSHGFIFKLFRFFALIFIWFYYTSFLYWRYKFLWIILIFIIYYNSQKVIFRCLILK